MVEIKSLNLQSYRVVKSLCNLKTVKYTKSTTRYPRPYVHLHFLWYKECLPSPLPRSSLDHWPFRYPRLVTRPVNATILGKVFIEKRPLYKL